MAYQADILINVKGFQDLGRIQKALEGTARKIDEVNEAAARMGAPVRNIERFSAQLQLAKKALDKVAIGSVQEQRAINNYVTALNNANVARSRQNTLIEEQIRLQRKAVDTRDAGFGVQGPKLPPYIPGPASPIKGTKTMPGSPAALAEAAKGARQAQDAQAKMQENLMLGAGFPLLFGGGAGQVAGGLLGSFVGTGFGGQILGSAIGQQLEDATRRIAEIGTALNELNMDALRDSAILVNSELTNQVRLLQEAGRADEARAAIAEQVTLQTGLLPAAVSDITNNTNLLGNTWNEFLGAVSGTLSIISAPFASVLTFILQVLAKALQGINFIATGLASIVKSAVEWAAKTLGLGGLLEGIKNQTTAISEEEQKRVAALQQLTDDQLKEIQNNRKSLQLESQRTLGRTAAEKQINAEIDSQLAKDKIRLEYADKAVKLREKYAGVTSEAGKRELDQALKANEALKQQALEQQRIKDLLVQQRAEVEANTQKYDEAAEAVRQQIAALERGNAVTQSRYNAEAALNDLYGAQLQRQYELATTAQQRFNIAIAMFNQQITAAQLEYEQALNNNKLLVEKAKLEANLVEIKYKQLEAEKAIVIAQAQSRGNTPEQIRSIAEAYDKGLGLQRDAVKAAYAQVEATVEIANNQNVVADAVYKTKVVQAESELAQKLVSKEIGMSKEGADRLAGSLASGVFQAAELGKQMNNVAQQAAAAAQQMQNAINLQNMLRSGGNQNAGAEQAAEGAYWSGGFKAFADGGMVTKPTLGLVGEGGEPEYIIPASKMDEAMSRYASGQRGSSVIPSSINPQVNVTTGPVMNMNGSNYVSQNDFLAGMQTASRRGAEMALQVLQSSNGIRRSVGIR